MEPNTTRLRPNPQRTYRRNQASRGLVRYEFQLSPEAKAAFEAMVAVIADEYDEPYDLRRRLARARAAVFEELTRGVLHEFTALQQRISALEAEIKALSPTFFAVKADDPTPLPAAIAALPDNPQQLKRLLANTYSAGQDAKRTAAHYQQAATRYQKLYETLTEIQEKSGR